MPASDRPPTLPPESVNNPTFDTRILDALIARGRAALEERDADLDENDRERLIGGALLDVVLASDFYVHAAVCIRHVVASGHSIHILCEDGSLCSILSKLDAHTVHAPNTTATPGLHPHDPSDDDTHDPQD